MQTIPALLAAMTVPPQQDSPHACLVGAMGSEEWCSVAEEAVDVLATSCSMHVYHNIIIKALPNCCSSGASIDVQLPARSLSSHFSPAAAQEAAMGGAYAGSPHAAEDPILREVILLAACGAGEVLPQSPDLPADVFTACLTTPIKVRGGGALVMVPLRLPPAKLCAVRCWYHSTGCNKGIPRAMPNVCGGLCRSSPGWTRQQSASHASSASWLRQSLCHLIPPRQIMYRGCIPAACCTLP